MVVKAVSHLLPNVIAGGAEQRHEDGHRTTFDHDVSVVRCARSHIRERPGRLKLHHA